MRTGAGALLAFLGVFGWSDAEAGTLKEFYFVGNPWKINNELGPNRSLMAVGRLRIDVGDIPAGTVAHHRTESRWNWDRLDVDSTPDFRSMTVDRIESDPANHRLQVDVQFAESGMPSSWTIREEPYQQFCEYRCYDSRGDAATGDGFVFYRANWYKDGYMNDQRELYLSDLGYTPDMPLYQRYVRDNDYWRDERVADGGGEWFDNLNDAARSIERNTAIALANPAKGLYQIAPIPLPAPLALLVAGLGALGLLRRRAPA